MLKKRFPKLNKKISYRIFISVVAVAALTAATIAWFAKNTSVSGSGLKSDAVEDSNLIIAKDLATLRDMTLADATYSIDFSLISSEVIPARHDPALASGKTASPTDNSYLQYDASPENVDKDSGLKGDGSFNIVPIGGTDYYTDYVVYLASTPAAMPKTKLTIKVSWTPKNDTEKAFSVDVYRVYKSGTTWKTSFLKTLNIDKKSTTVFSNSTIPKNTDGGYVKLILRCYFDGGLGAVDSETGEIEETYINSANLFPTEVKAKFTFTATDVNN